MKEIDKFNYEDLTPMFRHYVDIKKEYEDYLLFYRVGDFYESFFDDAIKISKQLQLTLTSKASGAEKKAPMCGVPYHSVDNYITRLVKNGFKVAMCDQVEDPKQAKGLVKREVTRIITPGTITDIEYLNNKENNFLLSIYISKNGISCSYSDVTTGIVETFELRGEENYISKLLIDQIEKINPSEIILNKNFKNDLLKLYIKKSTKLSISYIEDDKRSLDLKRHTIKNYLGEKSIINIYNLNLSINSCVNLLDYIYKFHKKNLVHFKEIKVVYIDEFMQLDFNTRKNLELFNNLNDNSKKNSVLDIIDMTNTPMGSRMLHSRLERPLLDKSKIDKRLDLVDFFYKNRTFSNKITDFLDDIYDIERLSSKISYGRMNARDFLSLKNSIENIPNLKKILISSDDNNIKKLGQNIEDLDKIYTLINNSIVEDPPILITDGGIIKDGFSKELDELKFKSEKAKEDLLRYEQEQINITGIKNLKIKYNKINGYSIEITKSYIQKVPDNYIRKQTLKNQERYTTSFLEELSSLILGGKELIDKKEYEIFMNVRDEILNNIKKIQSVSNIISILDVINSLAKVAFINRYTKPIINDDNIICIKKGRHPIIEQMLNENEFISNDTNIGQKDNLIQIITGPNMAGKSTYMRQTAIIIILAQIGSFVPADYAKISICDKVFTRIGAGDNISKGESTFMLEMKEVANILNNATEKSFVILDEVGRGTSTDDGLSIAISLVEYISKTLKTKTVFATHFHELTSLEKKFQNVKNLKIDIKEENGELVFLRKITSGSSDRSYGIEVAKMAGIPDEIIESAKNIIEYIDENNEKNFEDLNFSNIRKNDYIYKEKIDYLKKEVSKIDINNLTPLESINELYNLFERIKNI
ncbi:MAG: DNA mismatch repair protein MutS [Peptoniphilaceae bacterium]|nr:DNA mismatch repair protein MutS [Peptoniphilaceae bacterium]MDD7383807.1 DNA mismatch repair protein MutS [Peptoniphilaceae bacterium]MDY3737795.1 DNA mismatch repair protein MutS [Peptoniphilaceae bacterium]